MGSGSRVNNLELLELEARSYLANNIPQFFASSLSLLAAALRHAFWCSVADIETIDGRYRCDRYRHIAISQHY